MRVKACVLPRRARPATSSSTASRSPDVALAETLQGEPRPPRRRRPRRAKAPPPRESHAGPLLPRRGARPRTIVVAPPARAPTPALRSPRPHARAPSPSPRPRPNNLPPPPPSSASASAPPSPASPSALIAGTVAWQKQGQLGPLWANQLRPGERLRPGCSTLRARMGHGLQRRLYRRHGGPGRRRHRHPELTPQGRAQARRPGAPTSEPWVSVGMVGVHADF